MTTYRLCPSDDPRSCSPPHGGHCSSRSSLHMIPHYQAANSFLLRDCSIAALRAKPRSEGPVRLCFRCKDPPLS